MSLNQSKMTQRRGLTLIEILVGLTMTLIVLGAMMYAFRYASKEISQAWQFENVGWYLANQRLCGQYK